MNPRSSRLFFWFTQITSIIGLAGIIEDLKTWQKWILCVLEWAYSVQPWMATVLTDIGQKVHSVTDAWRYLMHPVIKFLFLWVPFEVPFLVKELVLIGLFAIAGWFRAGKLWEGDVGIPKHVRRSPDPAFAWVRHLYRQDRLELGTRITVVALSCGALVLIALDHLSGSAS